jgi:hypothetical protein
MGCTFVEGSGIESSPSGEGEGSWLGNTPGTGAATAEVDCTLNGCAAVLEPLSLIVMTLITSVGAGAGAGASVANGYGDEEEEVVRRA